MSGTIGAIVLGAVTLAIYFVPTFVAWRRKNHTAAIFALNLLFGWTLLGWVAALVMALYAKPKNGKEAA